MATEPAAAPVWRGPEGVPRAALVPLERLLEDPENPNDHGERSVVAIAASLAEYGQQKNAVHAPARDDGVHVMVAGSGMLAAARRLGWTHLWSLETDLREAYQDGYRIADNESARRAKQHDENTARILARIRDAGTTRIDATGHSLSAAERLIAKVARRRAEYSGEDAPPPAPPADPLTQQGEVLLLGDHAVFCGDTFDDESREAFLERAAPSGARAVITDPPYAIYGSSTGLGHDVSDDKMVRPFFRRVLQIAAGLLPMYTTAHVFCDWRSWASWWEVSKGTDLVPKNMLVWDKGDGGLGSNYQNCHELAAYFVRLPKQTRMTQESAGHIPPVQQPNLLRHGRVKGDEREHNAVKPTELLIDLMENVTARGDLVADLFMGSGSTVIAAEMAGRRAVGFEFEPGYADVIAARWERLTGKRSRRVLLPQWLE